MNMREIASSTETAESAAPAQKRSGSAKSLAVGREKPAASVAKSATEVRRQLREKSGAAVAFLVSVMQDEEMKTELRMKAAESILDRACGKASSSGAAATATEETRVTRVQFEGVLEEWSE